MRNTIVLLLALLVLIGGAGHAEEGSSALARMNGKRIGVTTGSVFDAIVLEALPDCKISYINNTADMIASLESGKIDGFVADEPALWQICAENDSISMLDEYLDTFEFAFVLPKSDEG